MLRQLCVALFVVIAKGDVEVTSGTQCFTNGSILVKNPDPVRFGFFHIKAGNDDKKCSGAVTEDSTHLLLNNCPMDVPIQILFLRDNRGIIRGDNHAAVRVQCNIQSNIQVFGILQVGEDPAVQTEIINFGGALIVLKRPVTVQTNTAASDTSLRKTVEQSIDVDKTAVVSVDETTKLEPIVNLNVGIDQVTPQRINSPEENAITNTSTTSFADSTSTQPVNDMFANRNKDVEISGTQCFTNGSILVKNPDPVKYGFFHIEAGKDNSCSGALTEDSTHLLLNNCPMDVPIQVLFLRDNRGIIRGDNHAAVKFKCNLQPDNQVSGILQVGDEPAVPTEIINFGGSLIMIKRPVTSSVQTNTVASDSIPLNWLLNIPEPSIDVDEKVDGSGSDEIVTPSTTDRSFTETTKLEPIVNLNVGNDQDTTQRINSPEENAITNTSTTSTSTQPVDDVFAIRNKDGEILGEISNSYTPIVTDTYNMVTYPTLTVSDADDHKDD